MFATNSAETVRLLTLPGLANRLGDVGGDVLGVLARDEVGRHQRQRLARGGVDLRVAVRVEDLAVDDALYCGVCQPRQEPISLGFLK